jgi:hypothetical protein
MKTHAPAIGLNDCGMGYTIILELLDPSMPNFLSGGSKPMEPNIRIIVAIAAVNKTAVAIACKVDCLDVVVGVRWHREGLAPDDGLGARMRRHQGEPNKQPKVAAAAALPETHEGIEKHFLPLSNGL